MLASAYKILGETRYLVVDIVAEGMEVVADAVHKAYAHSDGAHVEVLLLYHFVGFDNLVDVNHTASVCMLLYDLRFYALHQKSPRAGT